MESPNSGSWQPNEELLEMLTAMGISKIAAEHALYYTGNQSAEAAACYVFDNPDIDVMPSVLTTQTKSTFRSKKNKTDRIGEAAGSSDDEEYEDSYKMVFVVNSSLNMGPGKLASQVAHAALGLYRTLRISAQGIQDDAIVEGLYNWENEGEKKIVLRGVDENHLRELESAAQNIEGLHVQTIIDAGLTQVAPDSLTVLAIFGKEQIIDKVTGELPLL